MLYHQQLGYSYYWNSVLHRVSAANVQSLQNVLNAAARIIGLLRKQKFDHITADFRDQLCWLQRIVCAGLQVSSSASTNLPRRNVHTSVCIH